MEDKRLTVPLTPMSCESDYEFWEDYERRPVLKDPKSKQVEVKVITSPEVTQTKLEAPPSRKQSKSPATTPQLPVSPQPIVAPTASPSIQVAHSIQASPSLHASQSHSPEPLSPLPSESAGFPESQGVTPESSGPVKRTPTARVVDNQGSQRHAKHDDLLAENLQLQSEAVRLRTLLYEQETELSRLRVILRAPKEAHKQVQWTEPSADTQVLQTQVSAFTDLLEYYEQQTEASKQAKDRMAVELEGIRGVHNTELARVREECRSRELHTQTECERLQKE